MKGKEEAVKVYEVYGQHAHPLDPVKERYYKTYNEAFEAFLSRDFTNAMDGFREALSLQPHDQASREMLSRIEADHS